MFNVYHTYWNEDEPRTYFDRCFRVSFKELEFAHRCCDWAVQRHIEKFGSVCDQEAFVVCDEKMRVYHDPRVTFEDDEIKF